MEAASAGTGAGNMKTISTLLPGVRLGDIEVARIGLGTNRLTNTPANVAFIERGGRGGRGHHRHRPLYTGGDSERAIGEALSPVPDGVVVATKGGCGDRGSGQPGRPRGPDRGEPAPAAHRQHRLYYLHRVDPETPLEESLGAIKEYRDRGKIRHVGLSEVSIDQIERAREVVPIAAVQNHYNLSERKHEDVVDHCEREGIVFVPFFPLRGDGGPALAEIAARHGATPRRSRSPGCCRRSPAMLPIPGTLSLEHLKENLAALQIELTDAEFEALR